MCLNLFCMIVAGFYCGNIYATVPNYTTNTNYYNENYNNIKIDIAQETIAHAAASVTTTVIATIENKIMLLMQNLAIKYTHYKEQVESAISRPFRAIKELYEWSFDHKWKLGLLGIVSCYAYGNYVLYAMKKKLSDQQLWSLWNRALSLEDLFAYEHNYLAEMLVQEAQKRYTSPQNPGDFITPLSTFMHALEYETTLLTSYVYYYDWIATLCVQSLMPRNDTFIAECKERMTRLSYFKTVFIHWLTEYKFMHHCTPQHPARCSFLGRA